VRNAWVLLLIECYDSYHFIQLVPRGKVDVFLPLCTSTTCDPVSLCFGACPGTYSVDQARLVSTHRDPPASAFRMLGLKVMIEYDANSVLLRNLSTDIKRQTTSCMIALRTVKNGLDTDVFWIKLNTGNRTYGCFDIEIVGAYYHASSGDKIQNFVHVDFPTLSQLRLGQLDTIIHRNFHQFFCLKINVLWDEDWIMPISQLKFFPLILSTLYGGKSPSERYHLAFYYLLMDNFTVMGTSVAYLKCCHPIHR
ncbi:hypothetical protein STEG23_014375, partial [Scotinomys teguina]